MAAGRQTRGFARRLAAPKPPKRCAMFRFLVFALSIIAIGAGVAQPAPGYAQSSPEEVVRAVGDALAAGDIEGALALYADGAAVTDRGTISTAWVGRPALRSLFELTAGISTSFANVTSTTTGNTVVDEGEWSDDISAAAGVSRYLTHLESTVEDGKIVRSDLTYDASDPQTAQYLAFIASLPPWSHGAGAVTLQASGGTVVVSQTGDVSMVEVRIAEGEAVLLRQGACGGDGPIVSELATLASGASTTFVSVPMATLFAGGVNVEVHETGASSPVTACVALQSAPATAPSATAAPPSAGTGLAASSESTSPLLAAGAVLIAASIGLGAVAFRRR